ncbi:Flp pilus assembly complex ATPase component TadA [Deefgea piscis]|uniref:Flp pilus assembly complex ATPase component TadA n=1 Tax=Deefgea piscis TaxID=2739061 RepID=A0A6M8SR95_9NEIS|nr:GspE/PulE family protein [Deefgea piscis]QKJ66020.1 Flp pilus assembly complex ATPase component TadA [Deefgea piscis]
MLQSTKRRLGEQLIDKGLISDDQLRIALLEQRQSGLLLGKILVDLGFLSDHVLREALSENLGQVSIDLSRVICDALAIALLPKAMAKRLLILPIGLNPAQTKLTVAMANPNHLLQIDQLRLHTQGQFEIEVVLAAESDLIRAIDQYYGFELSIDGILREIETGEIDYGSLNHSQFEYSQPVVRLIDALLADAVRCGASDIHFEPESSFVRIRYRIDGVLRQIRALHKTYWPAMVVRLKVLAQMNIAETRAAQDGRISLTLAGRAMDFRVSAQPTSWGENLVLRILDRQNGLLSLAELDLSAANLALLQQMIRRPAGMILLTGPTGSGKTTTLYSILNHINSVALNIMTLEDPVEYPLPLIRQTSVSEAAKMDFVTGIRSMLRQDPDVILIGEIRDHATAEMAFQAAMTGHLVYSTLHSNSAMGAVPRLLDIGVLPDILSGNIIGIIAQRLIRRLCMACREGYSPDEYERSVLQLDTQDVQIYRAVGCAQCAQQGYQGRSTVSEILKLDLDLDELIARRASFKEIRELAMRKGFKSLADDACRRVKEGVSTFDEIARVVDLSERMP